MSGVRPADFPAPLSTDEVVVSPEAGPDERIDVGIAIVGGGPAGLACATRLGQLLEEHPAVRERLGDYPVAVLEKGKQPGSHLLSGAVMNPRAIRTLLAGRPALEAVPTYGEVEAEAVYVLSRNRALRIPPPPPMRNHGNWIVSLSALGRFLGEQAEACGATMLPETVADRLLVDHGRVVGVRTGDKGRGKEGEPLGNFEPGMEVTARLTVLAEGTAGHLTYAAIDRFGLRGAQPQIWALGVKEVWRVATPLRRIVHTMGWPLRKAAKHGEFGGSWIYPMGDDHVSIGFVVGLEYADVELSAHDLLQEFKTHPLVRRILEGGERVAWGAKTITEGGLLAMPSRLNAPGLLLAGESAGLVNVPRLKGVHYAIESGRLAAEAAFAALADGEVAGRPGALDGYDAAIRSSYIGQEMRESRNMRQVFDKGFFVGGALASAMTVTKGKLPPKDYPTHSNAETALRRTGRAASYPAPDGSLTFDKLSSVFAAGNRTRDDQPNHVRVQERVPRDVAEMWAWMCPAQVYEVGAEHDDGTVDVRLTPSNCVQCGAITAKGGRLTPPEGGSGPEYTLT